MGLQASSRLSKLIRRLYLIRGLVVVEEVVKVEAVKFAVVVANHIIKVRIEGVGEREDPVLKELLIRLSGCRKVVIASEVMLMKRLIAKIREMIEVVDVEAIQGRCSSD